MTESVLIDLKRVESSLDFECVDRLISSLELYPQCELESDEGSSCRWQLILQKCKFKIQEVLRDPHDSVSEERFGIIMTLHKTREQFYWDQLRAHETSRNGADNAELVKPEKDAKQNRERQ
ncbi:hypothetical protein AVEN_79919-1 [Araneus ventricosus]|uniref:Uncharacterized protein n=1 Tax=Araneus ventricosus TaxID=182803 RepID=A0A4Y2GL92_ARAVE|nr:hypothetical protein AVEN_79919-1 [Araneus ventricosus]